MKFRYWLLAVVCLLCPVNAMAVTAAPQLYVGFLGSNKANSYNPTSFGNVAPTASITGGSTGLNNPIGVAIDGAGHLWTQNNSSTYIISEFTAGTTGNVSPLVTISGANTTLNAPQGISFDSSGNLWVANNAANSILEFSAAQLVAGGNIVPNVTISGASTTLSAPISVKVDSTGNIYVEPATGTTGVLIFAPGASGNVAPTASIKGASTTLNGNNLGQMALDSSANVYVLDLSADLLKIWDAGTTGNVAPSATLGIGIASVPRGIAVDASNRIYVLTDSTPNVIYAYAAGITGGNALLGTISGGSTGLGNGNSGFFLSYWNPTSGPIGAQLQGSGQIAGSAQIR